MPRSVREWARRKLMAACGHVDTALAHLGEIAELYEKPHPEIADPLYAIAQVLIEMGDAIKGVRKTF